MENLKKKKLELEEKYNFKEEEDKSWSFEFKKRKAFLINLADFKNKDIITPYIIRRSQLGAICDTLDDQFNRGEKPIYLKDFLNFSVEVISNILDKNKMGSIEHFINLIWKNVQDDNETLHYLNVIGTFGDIIVMTDYSSNIQLNTISQEKMKSIHTEYFKNNILKEDNSEPKNEYDLINMKPINKWEI